MPATNPALRTLRALGRRPAWSAAVVLVLALGSGLAGAVGGVAHGTLVRPLPYHDDHRLVALFTVERQGSEPRNPTSPANFLDWKRDSRLLRDMTAARPKTFTLTGHGAARELPALAATPELFALLGVEAALGRTFGSQDAESPQRIVLGADFWRRELGADPAVIGRALRLDGEPYEVVGVMPDGFRFPPFWATDAQAWVPLVFTPEQAADRDAAWLRVFARLAPGATLAAARAELASLADASTRREPANLATEPAGEGARRPAGAGIRPRPVNRDRGLNLEPLREPTVEAARPVLTLLLGAAALVLLVATASAANLLLARTLERRPEAALRLALGASRRDLLRAALGESVVLAAGGGALGLLLARALVRLVVTRFPAVLPPVARVDLDLWSAALPILAAVAALGVALLATLASPAARWQEVRGSRLVGGAGAAGGGRVARRLLVGVQVALAVVLLSGAAVTGRVLWELQRLDPGFAARGVLAVDLGLAASPAGEDAASQERFHARLVAEAARLPGVEAAAVVNHLPLRGDFWRSPLEVDGRAVAAAEQRPVASYRVVTPAYFRALGVPLRAGRAFSAADRADAEPVAIVNETLARRHFGAASPLDRRLRLGGADEPWMRVVGVVADARQTAITDPVVPELYLPYGQNPVAWHRSATLVLRQRGDTSYAAVSALVRALDPNVALARPQTLGEVLGDEVAPQRLQLLLVGAFAGSALLLALAGLYGMARIFVAARIPELGVRQALGAGRARLLGLVLAEGARVALPALLAGAALAVAGSRLLAARLPGATGMADLGGGGGWGAVAAASGVVGALALGVVWLQARRAAAVEPMAALRQGSAG